MNKALDEVRAEETRRMKQEGLDPVLRKSRWLLLKRQENLGDEQRFRLRDLLRYNLKTVRAYLLKEAFSNSGIAHRLLGLRRSWEFPGKLWIRRLPPSESINTASRLNHPSAFFSESIRIF
jgi:hypothetical protein